MSLKTSLLRFKQQRRRRWLTEEVNDEWPLQSCGSRDGCNQFYMAEINIDSTRGWITYLSTSRPFRWFATMSNKNCFSSGLWARWVSQRKSSSHSDLRPWTISRNQCLDELLIVCWYLYTIFLNESIEHHFRSMFMPPLRIGSVEFDQKRTRGQTDLIIYNARGIKTPSQTWLHGPWPRSWHKPAISTQSISRSEISSSGWIACRWEVIKRAK